MISQESLTHHLHSFRGPAALCRMAGEPPCLAVRGSRGLCLQVDNNKWTPSYFYTLNLVCYRPLLSLTYTRSSLTMNQSR